MKRTDAEAVRAMLVGVIESVHTIDADQIRERLGECPSDEAPHPTCSTCSRFRGEWPECSGCEFASGRTTGQP